MVEKYDCEKLTFILQDRKVIVRTPSKQAFYLLPNGYWIPRLNYRRLSLIRKKIRKGQIHDLNELAGYTRPGLTWTHIGIEECDTE